MNKQVLKVVGKNNRKKIIHATKKNILDGKFEGAFSEPLDSQYLLISHLLPPAVKLFMEEVEKEVNTICGSRYKHSEHDNTRWGSQKGSIILGNQKVALECPRVRNKVTNTEVPLKIYEEFQSPDIFKQAVFHEGLKKVSQRDYKKGLTTIANSFGIEKSSISRKWIASTTGKLKELQERSLLNFDIRVVFMDGKRFRKHGVLVALGIAADGRKHVLGIYQSSSENHEACLNLLNDLESRGLANEGLIFVVDGGSGLNKALEIKYDIHDKKKRRAIRMRCHVHKWWNLEKILGQHAHKAKGLFWALRDAKDISEAKTIADQLESVLKTVNQSALNSFLEAKTDLLAIHELKLSMKLKRLLSTTNPIESLNSLIEEDMRRVKNWKNSSHFQRWLATYCIYSETKMRKVLDARLLPGLWVEIKTKFIQNRIDSEQNLEQVA